MKELTLQEYKVAQLQILHEVHNFCEANDIKYSLAYGTLIGAVRHKGYIPWDDDIDICMLRKDYNKFISLFNENSGAFRVRALETDKTYTHTYAKVELVNTRVIDLCNSQMEIGVNIDVFPIDYICDDSHKRHAYYNKLKRKQQIYLIKSIKIAPSRNFFKNLILMLGQIILGGVSLRRLAENIDQYIEKDLISSTLCELGQCTYGLKSCFSIECMASYRKMPFEDGVFNVMEGYHEYLSNIYGKYMELPPIDKRVTHHSARAYKIN